MGHPDEPRQTPQPTPPNLEGEIDHERHGLERTDTPLASPAGSGETPPSLGEHSPQRRRAESMAFELEPVDLAMLEAEHARQPMSPVTSKPDSAA